MSNKNENTKKPVEKIHEFLAGELFTIKIEGDVVLDENLGETLAEFLDESPTLMRQWLDYSHEANVRLEEQDALTENVQRLTMMITKLLHNINSLGKRIEVDWDEDGHPRRVVRG